MISQSKQRGFTIVELLIVIVVIGILAAISIAAYTSITARANTANAQAAAKSVKDVAQNFSGLHGRFPQCKAEFTSGAGSTATGCGGATTDGVVAKMPSDITFATPSGSTDAKTVSVVPHGSPIAGFTITYRDFSAGSNKTMTVGDTIGTAGTAL